MRGRILGLVCIPAACIDIISGSSTCIFADIRIHVNDFPCQRVILSDKVRKNNASSDQLRVFPQKRDRSGIDLPGICFRVRSIKGNCRCYGIKLRYTFIRI